MDVACAVDCALDVLSMRVGGNEESDGLLSFVREKRRPRSRVEASKLSSSDSRAASAVRAVLKMVEEIRQELKKQAMHERKRVEQDIQSNQS